MKRHIIDSPFDDLDPELKDELRCIVDGVDAAPYILYRVAQILKAREKSAEDYGYILGWNAAIDNIPTKMRLPRKKRDAQ